MEGQPSAEASHDVLGDYQHAQLVEAPIEDSGSASNASSNSRKVRREDIELVSLLIAGSLI